MSEDKNQLTIAGSEGVKSEQITKDEEDEKA